MLDKAVMNKTHELQRAEPLLHFGYIHYTRKTKKQTESETSLHNMSQFANLNFSHLISLVQPKADGNVAVMF